MKRKFFAFILLLSAGLSLSSCLSSDDDTNIEYTHDTAITAFSLGTMNRYYLGKTSDGTKDSTYATTIAGSNYKFYIDQTAGKIYNADSLPVGTKISAALASITAKQSSPLFWVLKDKDNKDSLAYYSSSDSVDFSKPKEIRVFNNDYSAYRTYTITVNVHKEGPDSFVWHSLAAQNGDLAALAGMKAVSAGNCVYVFGKSNGVTKIFKTGLNGGAFGSALTSNVVLSEEAYKSAIAKDGKLYILNNGEVLTSDGAINNAINWESVTTDTSLLQLIGASSNYLYAYSAAGIAVSKDNGASWTPDAMDDKGADFLPTENLSLVVKPVRSVKGAENLLLLGNRKVRENEEKDTVATIWTRTFDAGEATDSYQWNYVEYQAGMLPYLNTLQVALNDSGYVALAAGDYKVGSATMEKCKWYVSKTGLDWSVDTTVVMPAEFAVSRPAAFVRDANNYYWVINNGYVWKGRYNRDGWRKE